MLREILISVRKESENSPYHNQYPTNKMSSTKYNKWNFLPLSLFQQLKSIINLFFICNGCLQTIPSIATNSPLVSLIPVSWVMLMGMIFEGVSDVKRWLNDNEINAQKIDRVCSDGSTCKNKQILSESLKVGDVIQLKNNEMVPADVVLLSTDDPLGQCFISTETLDGEMNLKPKFAPALTQSKMNELIGAQNVKVKIG